MPVELPEYIAEYFSYDPETGHVTWIKGTRKGERAGCEAYRKDGKPKHRCITFGGHFYLEHRIAFYLMNKGDVPRRVGHIDGNPFNNRWDNLRTYTKGARPPVERVEEVNQEESCGWNDHIDRVIQAHQKRGGTSDRYHLER